MNLSLDLCADFLSEKRFEKFILLILQLPIGTWFPLHKLLELDEYTYSESVIFVSWSHSLDNEDDFSLIIFCEEESMEMVTGNYNKTRLLRKT